MKLTEAMLTLSQYRAKIAHLEKKEKELCLKIKDHMQEHGMDEYAPRTVPLKLIKSEFEQITEGFYETIATKAYKELYGMLWDKAMERERERYPKKHVVRLNITAGNENYQVPKPEKKAA